MSAGCTNRSELPVGIAGGPGPSRNRRRAAQLGGDVVVRSHLDPKRPDPIDARLLAVDRERELIERIRHAAAQEPICRSTAQTSVQGGDHGFSISVSCAFDRNRSLNTVHAATESIEQRIRHAIPDAGHVIVHAEPAATQIAGYQEPGLFLVAGFLFACVPE